MAMSDYRLCDVCQGKAFYDSELNYDFSTIANPIPEDELVQDCHYRLDRLGAWAVLCKQCAKTHRVVIERIGAAREPEAQR